MESVRLDKQQQEQLFALPYGKTLEIHTRLSESSLMNTAMIGVSAALGNHPHLLNDDRNYFNFVASFVTEGICAYVDKAAGMQLALLSLGGMNTTRDTLALLLRELEKVKRFVIVNEEAAELILADADRSMNFLSAITAMTALRCKQDKRFARLFGLRKTFLGGLKYKGRPPRSTTEHDANDQFPVQR